MSSETRFQISVPDDALSLLRRKLDDAHFPDELSDAGWDYGSPLSDVKRLVGKWKDSYDWRAHERELNKLPMFTRDIEVEGFGALNIHYVHQMSTVESAIPLLFVHGWPGSFIEVTKVLPFLTATEAGHPSFHVVAPSLPGFAWSQAVSKRGFGARQYAELFNKLMLSLGYSEYVTQGGDWGSVLTRVLASQYGPQHVKASHTNLPLAGPMSFWKSPIQFIKFLITPFTTREREGLANFISFQTEGDGYFKMQSTRPQTLGYGLADSPVGMLGWIYEKLVKWTDSYPWTDEEVLTWLSIYWFSRAGPATSVRIYRDINFMDLLLVDVDARVPVGASFFRKELARTPRAFLRARSNVVFESEHDSGGHFASYEKPELLVDDLRKMFGKGGPAAGVVPGHSGF